MPAEVLFGGPGRQRRSTVAFRLVLAVPQVVGLAALGVAALPVAFVGWWAVLLTGRLPAWASAFLSGVVRHATRVGAYLGLLTDRYPPFAFGDADYVVQVRHNREPLEPIPVMFRFVTVLPAALVLVVTAAGWLIAAPFLWLAVLAFGRVPRPVFGATAAVLRYQSRYWSYLALLAPDYPLGLFGDPPAAPSRRLVLSSGGQALLAVIVSLGAAAGGGVAVAEVSVFGSASSGLDLRLSVASAYQTLSSRMDDFQAAGCSGATELECRRAAAGRLAGAFRRFGDELRGVDFGADVAAQAAAVEEDSDLMASTLDRMAAAGDLAAYQQASAAGHVAKRAATFDADYRNLARSVGAP